MLQRLPIALAQVKAGNTSKDLLNEFWQIMHYLCRAKEITKKVYNNIVNSVNVKYKWNTIFMNSKNSKISDPRRLLLNLADKIDLRRKAKYIVLSNRNIYYTCKNIKKSYKNNKFKISTPAWN